MCTVLWEAALADKEINSVEGNFSIKLEGALCFQVMQNISDRSKCILLYNQTAAWLDPIRSSAHSEASNSINGTWISGWWPASRKKGNTTVPSQPRWAPFCEGIRDDILPPWTGCQAQKTLWAIKGYFPFSPYMSTYYNETQAGFNWTYQNPNQVGGVNPFDHWLLCGVNGSCTELSPLAVIVGRGIGNAPFSWNTSDIFESSMELIAGGQNVIWFCACVSLATLLIHCK